MNKRLIGLGILFIAVLIWAVKKAKITSPLPPLPSTPVVMPYPSLTPPPDPVPPELDTLELALNGISILSINGIPFSEVGVRTVKYWDERIEYEPKIESYSIPQGTLAESAVDGNGLPVTVVWRIDSPLQDFDRLVFQWFITYDYLEPEPPAPRGKAHGWMGGNAYTYGRFPGNLPKVGDVINTQIESSNILQTSQPNKSTIAVVQVRLFGNDNRVKDWEFAVVNI